MLGHDRWGPLLSSQRPESPEDVAVSSEKDAANYGVDINFVPLRFRSKTLEYQFRQVVNALLLVRCKYVAAIGILYSFAEWAAIVAMKSFDILPCDPVPPIFHVVVAVRVLSQVPLVFLALIPCLRNHAEAVLLMCYACYFCVGALGLSTVCEFARVYEVLHALEWKILIDCAIAPPVLFALLAVDCACQTRTRCNWAMHLYICVVIWGILVMQYRKFGQFSDFIKILVIAQIAGISVVALYGFGARYANELQERINFIRMDNKERQLRVIQEQANLRETQTEKAVDQLLGYLSKAKECISQITTMRDPDAAPEGCERLYEFMSRTTEQLTKAENLFDMTMPAVDVTNVDPNFMAFWFPDAVKPKPDTTPNPNVKARPKLSRDVIRKSSNVTAYTGEIETPKQIILYHYDIGRTWALDFIALATKTPTVLVEAGYVLLQWNLDELDTDEATLLNFLSALHTGYEKNPYHNAIHGASVAHASMCLTKYLRIADSEPYGTIQEVALIVASLGHDVAHRGRSNLHYINTRDSLALFYNDKSILENFHCYFIFRLLLTEGCGVFNNLSRADFHTVRSHIIELVLSTDMEKHWDFMASFRVRSKTPDFCFLSCQEDMWSVLKLCIKVADLSHVSMDWNQHLFWSLCITEEFYQQGEVEEELGLTVNAHQLRREIQHLPKNQKGFLDFIAQPLLNLVNELCVTGFIESECMLRLEANRRRWEQMMKEGSTVLIPPEVRQLKTGRPLRIEYEPFRHEVKGPKFSSDTTFLTNAETPDGRALNLPKAKKARAKTCSLIPEQSSFKSDERRTLRKSATIDLDFSPDETTPVTRRTFCTSGEENEPQQMSDTLDDDRSEIELPKFYWGTTESATNSVL